ncbi:hypothetical protein TPA2_gp12 [Tsukamurella phage TPA2]|uniref:hypothetical protein n=1 Tax=Tsukamurella phage TPA2 TaxID=981330 RepID=UPI0001FF8DA3|nr:hypothetical protein TPA2_gp12 [Tsukamurella phage TPA2]ADX31926.1 hypothetical protein [Tsukamurella phage TPA2]
MAAAPLDEATLARLRAAVGHIHETNEDANRRRNLAKANRERSRRASVIRVAEAAQCLTDLTVPYSYAEAAALRMRVDHPDDTLTELAARVNMSRFSMSSALRRARIKAQRAGVLKDE